MIPVRLRSRRLLITIGIIAAAVLLTAGATMAMPEHVRTRDVVRDRVVMRVVTRTLHHYADGTVSEGDGHTHGSSTTTTVHNHSDSETTDSTATTTGHVHSSGTTTGSTTAHNHDPGVDPTGDPGHDHGGDGGYGNEWESVRRAALMGGLDTATTNARTATIRRYLKAQILRRSYSLSRLAPAEAERRVNAYIDWTLKHALDGEHGDATGNHAHGPQVWKTMDPATTARLQAQLKVSAGVVARYPTAADAMADGYFQVTPWAMGIGAHYLNTRYVRSFDPAHPAMLLYNGNEPSSEIVGLSFAVLGTNPPAGFAGPNDTWHTHPALCIVGGAFVVGADNTPADLCHSIGGAKSNGFGTPFWMMHVWQAPGWESGWGIFSPEDPAVNLATTDIR